MHWCADETAMVVTAVSSIGMAWAWLRTTWARLWSRCTHLRSSPVGRAECHRHGEES